MAAFIRFDSFAMTLLAAGCRSPRASTKGSGTDGLRPDRGDVLRFPWVALASTRVAAPGRKLA